MSLNDIFAESESYEEFFNHFMNNTYIMFKFFLGNAEEEEEEETSRGFFSIPSLF